MTKRVFLDFESRSQADIWKTGAYRYAEDPTTEVLCLAYAIDDGEIRGSIRGPGLQYMIPFLNKLIKEGAEFHAHNAFFERCIWKFQLTPKYGALPIPITQWRCTAAKVASHALPRSLEKAGLALGCTAQKDMEGRKLMLQLCKTTGPIPLNQIERLLLYCKRDVETEREIDRKLPDLCPSEQRVWFMDQYINDTGVRVDLDAISKATNLIETETKVLNKELFDLTGGLVNAGTQREAIKRYLESKGVSLPDLTKSTVKAAIAKTDGSILRVLQLRQQLSLTSNAKYFAIASAVSRDQRIRDTLVYHGASTGRWSGKLVQLQNLVKATLSSDEVNSCLACLKQTPENFSMFYDVLPSLSACIRGLFIPSEGSEMFITDFAAIEARVVMWLSGETKGIEMFQVQDKDPNSETDIYVHMARVIHNNQGLTKKNKKERQLGKQTILGCGYGMGVNRFKETCKTYEIEVTDELADKAVKSYRKVFSRVPNFWYEMEAAAKQAVISGNPHPCGKLLWYVDGEFLRLKLPSGRTLAYYRPKVNVQNELTFMSENSLTKKFTVETVWGGILVENATQAVARDLMVESMFRLIKAGHTILFTVHDELVTENIINKTNTQEVAALVKQNPSWALDCPINAECEKAMRYKK